MQRSSRNFALILILSILSEFAGKIGAATESSRGATNVSFSEACLQSKFSSRVLIPYILSNYSSIGRPVLNSSQPIRVSVSLYLWGILEFDERADTVSLHGYFHQSWNDQLLVWNDVFPYNCVKYVILPANKIWTPSLSIRNSPDAGRKMLFDDKHKAYVTPSGRVDFDPQGQFEITCEADLTYYPFDEQVCHIQLESWNYGTEQVKVTVERKNPFSFPPNEWTEHPMWQLVENYSYSQTDEGFDSAVFMFRLRRKPLFYYINIIAPSIIIAAVVTVIFTLPVDVVPKLDISVTCLVAYTVFQTYVVTDMPKSSEAIPLLILYIDLQMIYIAGIAICGQSFVFFFVQKGMHDEEPPPRWLAKSSRMIGSIFLVYKIRKRLNQGDDHPPANGKKTDPHHSGHESAKPASVKVQWLAIADVADRVLMVLYLLAWIITPIVMYHGVPTGKYLHPPEKGRAEVEATACYKCGDLRSE